MLASISSLFIDGARLSEAEKKTIREESATVVEALGKESGMPFWRGNIYGQLGHVIGSDEHYRMLAEAKKIKLPSR